MQSSDYRITEKDVAALRAGDTAALERIFIALQPRVFRFLWVRTRSLEMSEDLVQETFLRLWDGRDRLRPTDRLETYVFRTASNLLTDTLRRDERHRELQAANVKPEVSATTSSDSAESKRLAQIVDHIVATLPDASRTAFALSRYEELTHKEIAEVMDISVKTVEKHISKALQVLKTELEKFDVGRGL